MLPERSRPPNLAVFATASEDSAEFDIADPELVSMLEESQRRHFWFPARNRRILDFLRRDGVAPPARILEVGCGTGTVLSALARAGYAVTGIEMHERLARRAAEANPGSRIFALDLLHPPEVLLRLAPFDAVALFDVVEHLESPGALLRACAALVGDGGLVVGTVPALPVLWSDYDAYAGHRVRFVRRSLRRLLDGAGLPGARTAYFFQSLTPGMLARRLLVGRGAAASADDAMRRAAQHAALDAPGRAFNAAFAAACAAESALARGVSLLDAVPGASLWFSVRIPPGSRAQRGDATHSA